MDIIPVIDILNNHVVKALKGNRQCYEPISTKLYNSTEPREIIYQIVAKYSPKIIYIADLNAIIENKVNHQFFQFIFKKYPNIDFWVDSGLNDIFLNRVYKNYVPIFCSENSKGYELLSRKYINHICSLDYKDRLLGAKPLHRLVRSLPKKVIMMDLLRIGGKLKPNFHLAKSFIRKTNNREFYIAGGVKSLLEIKQAKKLGAKGVLVSTIIHMNKLNKYSFLK